MKKLAWLIVLCIAINGCQKSFDPSSRRERDALGGASSDSVIVSADTLLKSGDTLTYEVITTDRRGWFGMWSDAPGTLVSNALESITYGSPIYLPSGWKHTFICPAKPFQALISVAASSFADDITANLYKNGKLIKTISNGAMRGITKLLCNTNADTLKGTAADPVLTYEILVSDQDTTKFQSDSWYGQWNKSNGTVNGIVNGGYNILTLDFAIPAGWRYSFKPDKLPFTMMVGAGPYTKGGAKVTINFYVNGQLVKSAATRDWTYNLNYLVQ
jgi:hypothetical protein